MPELDARVLQRVARHWQAFVDQGRIVGGVLLLAQDGEVRYASARGWADRERGVPMQRQTRFRLASLSKLLTSITALRLCEMGVLALDAPVTCWLRDFRPRLADGREPVIELRHLLSHTAGLSYGFEQLPGNGYERAGVSDGLDVTPIGLEENLRRLAGLPLLFEPGTAWGYSVGTDVIGAVIEQATGESLGVALARWVTGPSGMTDTGFPQAGDVKAELAVAYKDSAFEPSLIQFDDVLELDSGQARVSSARAFDPGQYQSGGAGVLGTANDYLKLLECLRLGGAALLSEASVGRLVGNAIGEIGIKGRGPGWKFGLGPAVLTDPLAAQQVQGAGTWSWCGVYGSHYWVDPVARISLVAMTNTTVTGAWGEFADGLVAAIYSRG